MKSYRDLEVYQLSYRLAREVHEMTLKLPKYEMYEQGSQVRRSSKSIKDHIAESYGRRRYKDEFIRFLIFAHASYDEAISQLHMISEIHFPEEPSLGRKLYSFIQYVESNWNNPQHETRNLQP